jgi:hypothetical protein
MNEAAGLDAVAIQDNNSGGGVINIAEQEVIDLKSKKRHYHDMFDFLEDLSSITRFDYDGGVSTPVWLFKEHPIEAFAAFAPRYGSSLDQGINLELATSDNVEHLPAVSRLISVLNDFCGSLSVACEGSVRFMFYSRQQLAGLMSSLAPSAFLILARNDHPGGYSLIGAYSDDTNGVQAADAELNEYMQAWSNEELWNKQKYNQWVSAKKATIPELSAFYVKHLSIAPAKAALYANAAVNGLSIAYLGSHEHGVEEKAQERVYQIFCQPQLSKKEMEQRISSQPLSADELSDALRLAILNNASPEVIESLLKQGAQLQGVREPALFSAVLRPDVVSLLIKSGANVNEANPLGKTALIQAAQ